MRKLFLKTFCLLLMLAPMAGRAADVGLQLQVISSPPPPAGGGGGGGSTSSPPAVVATPVVIGWTSPNAFVEAILNNQIIYTTVAGANGSFSINIAPSAAQTIILRSTDIFGNAVQLNQAVDLAEWITYSGDQPVAGELVSVDSSNPITVTRSTGKDDKKILGVVSTNPHTAFGKDDGHSVLLTLAGRIPVNVSDENGSIKAGDYLTSSSVPGTAMHATKAGMVVGQALADEDNGTVIMLVKNTYYPGNGPTLEEVLGSATSLADLPSGVTSFVVDVQNEAPHDAVSTITDKISNGVKVITDFVAARVTAIRGYFDETHQRKLCVGDAASGNETCVTKDQLDQLLNNSQSSLNAPSAPPVAPSASPTPAPTSADAVLPANNEPTTAPATNTNAPDSVTNTPVAPPPTTSPPEAPVAPVVVAPPTDTTTVTPAVPADPAPTAAPANATTP